MKAADFASLAWLGFECFWHDDDPYYQRIEHFEQLMHYLDVPREWWEPIRVMTQGECYYGADGWIEANRYNNPLSIQFDEAWFEAA